MVTSMPPRTMRDVSREQASKERPGSITGGFHINIGPGNSEKGKTQSDSEVPFQVAPVNKPRKWKFQTKPAFKCIKGPLIDIFPETDEVLIVIDLGPLQREDLAITVTPEKYCICSKREGFAFTEEIPLPAEVDLDHCTENFRNGVLEITLPRKKTGEGEI